MSIRCLGGRNRNEKPIAFQNNSPYVVLIIICNIKKKKNEIIHMFHFLSVSVYSLIRFFHNCLWLNHAATVETVDIDP